MPAPIDDIEERKIKIMQQIDETKSMRELAVIVKNLPELCFGMPVEPHREQIYKHIEQRRKFFKEQQRIV